MSDLTADQLAERLEHLLDGYGIRRGGPILTLIDELVERANRYRSAYKSALKDLEAAEAGQICAEGERNTLAVRLSYAEKERDEQYTRANYQNAARAAAEAEVERLREALERIAKSWDTVRLARAALSARADGGEE